MAELTWFGHSCFRIKAREATIITDPFEPQLLGWDYGKTKADIITSSRLLPAYNFTENVTGSPRLVTGPGEYEISEVFITGIGAYADNEGGKQRGKNTIFVFELEGMVICHLGALGHTLTSEQQEMMSNVDVLLIPAGGKGTINANQASDVISSIEPHIVIPMHYRVDDFDPEQETLEKFAKEMGLATSDPVDKLVIKSSDLPEGTKIVVLDYKNISK